MQRDSGNLLPSAPDGAAHAALENHEAARPVRELRSPSWQARGNRGSAPRKSHPVRTTIIVIAAVALVVAGYMRIMQTRKAAAEKQAGPPRGGFAVPIVAGTVEQKDVPIYLDGLGTVQALNTAAVRSRVDGEILKIAFTEGQDVKQGDVLAQIDPAPYKAVLDQALARQRTDQAKLESDKLDLKRYADLLKKTAIAQQQVDQQTALVAQDVATVQNDAGAVEAARVNVDYCTIASPFDGRTGIRQIDIGNIVHATDATGIVVISQLKPISVIFTLPEQMLKQIHKEQEETPELGVLAVARDNKTVFDTGKLMVIDNQIDITTGTIKLKAEFPNEHLQLWPGEFVNARLLLSTRKAGVVVPAAVIQRGPDSSFAYVIEGDDATGMKAEMRTVKVGQIEQGEALVEEGLKPGERVVVDGQYKLQPGSAVKSVEPAAPGGGPGRGGKPGGGSGKPGAGAAGGSH